MLWETGRQQSAPASDPAGALGLLSLVPNSLDELPSVHVASDPNMEVQMPPAPSLNPPPSTHMDAHQIYVRVSPSVAAFRG